MGPDLQLSLTVFYRCLATMLLAGVPVERSLALLAGQCEHPGLALALGRCSVELRRGQSLSQAMAYHPRYFSAVSVAMIRIGEETGALHRMLPRLAEQQEKGRAVVQRMRGALAYPAFIFGVCLLAMLLLPGLALEPLLGSLAELGVPLSWPTRTVMALYAVESSPVAWLLGMVGLLFAPQVWRWARRRFDLRERAQRLGLRLPVLGEVLRLQASIEFCRTLALLLESGVPLLKTLDLLRTQTRSVLVREALVEARAGLLRGESLGQSLVGLPSLVGRMLVLGEDCGRPGELLESVVQVCEGALEHTLAVLQASVVPVALGVLGLLAGFLMIATLGPVVQLAQSL